MIAWDKETPINWRHIEAAIGKRDAGTLKELVPCDGCCAE